MDEVVVVRPHAVLDHNWKGIAPHSLHERLDAPRVAGGDPGPLQGGCRAIQDRSVGLDVLITHFLDEPSGKG